MTASYRLFKTDLAAGRWACWHTPEWTPEFLRDLLSGIGAGAGRTYRTWTLPDGAKAFVKVYNPRPKHNALRRLRHSRAIAEGRGYLAFAEAGIPTPRLLAWGEARRRWFWTQGLVITQHEPSPTVADKFRTSRDVGALERAMECLALIHQGGLAHGDARLRNFFASEQGVLAFDLCSWERLGTAARKNDLVRFLGSSLTLTDREVAAGLLQTYARAIPNKLDHPAVLQAAATYASVEKEP